MRVNSISNLNYTGLRTSLDDKTVEALDYVLEEPKKPYEGDNDKIDLVMVFVDTVINFMEIPETYVLRASAYSPEAGFLKLQITKDLDHKPVIADVCIPMKKPYENKQKDTIYPCDINISYKERIELVKKLQNDALNYINSQAAKKAYE